MNEKRFFTKINNKGRLVIIDKECHTELFDMTLACEVLNRLDLKLKHYNEVNGEQQATIKSKDKQLERLYNYFQDYLKDEMSGNSFSEMWDFVKEDESWEDE